MNAQERKQLTDIADNEAWDEILKALSEAESNYLVHLESHENQTRILNRQRKLISESQSQRVKEDRKRALDTESVLASNYVDDRQNAFASQFAEIEMVEETVSEVDWEDLDPNDRDAFKKFSVFEPEVPKQNALCANASLGTKQRGMWKCMVPSFERQYVPPTPWRSARCELRRAAATESPPRRERR